VTADLTEGNVFIRRGIFRKFNFQLKHKKDIILGWINQKLNGLDDSYREIIEWA
jgi:hypothetical protein